jgi:hypothetical protein
LVLTYALPAEVLRPLLPPGLRLDVFAAPGQATLGFLAIALVQTRQLRPSFVPAALGKDFFLSGYRIFARYASRGGRTLRGLRILRSDTDSSVMVAAGNALTHYRYRKCEARVSATTERLDIRVLTPDGEADVDVSADLTSPPALPPGSPFPDLAAARRFAGPLPFTFDYEEETHSIVLIEAVRQHWEPRPVRVDVRECSFLDRPPFAGAGAVLANAFHVSDIPYRWKRGVVEALPAVATP